MVVGCQTSISMITLIPSEIEKKKPTRAMNFFCIQAIRMSASSPYVLVYANLWSKTFTFKPVTYLRTKCSKRHEGNRSRQSPRRANALFSLGKCMFTDSVMEMANQKVANKVDYTS